MTPIALTALALTGLSPWLLEPSATTEQKKDKKSEVEVVAVDPDEAKTVWEYLSGRYDTNGDGVIDKKEYTRGSEQFARLDKDKNGFIDEDDTAQAQGRGERGGRRGGGGGRGGSRQTAPTEGSKAPGFELETLYPVEAPADGEVEAKKAKKKPEYKSVSLKSFKGEKPVALIFGSYT
jgi:hypothetical protein